MRFFTIGGFKEAEEKEKKNKKIDEENLFFPIFCYSIIFFR